MLEQQTADRKTSEEERFKDDYYSYFELPESATRYTPTAFFLNEAFKQGSFSLFDLGCGNGALSKYLPAHCDYLGADHSELAIEYCSKLYLNRNFLCRDLSVLLPEFAAQNRKFDAVVLAGLLFHATDKESLDKKDDQEIIRFCLDNIISDRGYLVIIVPFAYGDHPAHSPVRPSRMVKEVSRRNTGNCKGKNCLREYFTADWFRKKDSTAENNS